MKKMLENKNTVKLLIVYNLIFFNNENIKVGTPQLQRSI